VELVETRLLAFSRSEVLRREDVLDRASSVTVRELRGRTASGGMGFDSLASVMSSSSGGGGEGGVG
jgi:hypothetical protein